MARQRRQWNTMKYGVYYNDSYLQMATDCLEELGNATGTGSWCLPDRESKQKDIPMEKKKYIQRHQ